MESKVNVFVMVIGHISALSIQTHSQKKNDRPTDDSKPNKLTNIYKDIKTDRQAGRLADR